MLDTGAVRSRALESGLESATSWRQFSPTVFQLEKIFYLNYAIFFVHVYTDFINCNMFFFGFRIIYAVINVNIIHIFYFLSIIDFFIKNHYFHLDTNSLFASTIKNACKLLTITKSR